MVLVAASGERETDWWRFTFSTQREPAERPESFAMAWDVLRREYIALRPEER